MKRIIAAALLVIMCAGLVFVIVRRTGTEARPQPTPTPAAEVTPTVTATSAPTPEPTSSLPEVDLTSWELQLVNAENPLPEDFEPVTVVTEGVFFDERAASALSEFCEAARSAGLNTVVTSGYRSYAEQSYTYQNKVTQLLSSYPTREEAEAKAATIVAPPGTSEHQTGLCADIVDGYYEYKTETLADTALAQWMYAHCAEYGFILRYPKDKTGVTGIMFEPWHFRYVGKTAAAYIMENGLCLEEYIELYK